MIDYTTTQQPGIAQQAECIIKNMFLEYGMTSIRINAETMLRIMRQGPLVKGYIDRMNELRELFAQKGYHCHTCRAIAYIPIGWNESPEGRKIKYLKTSANTFPVIRCHNFQAYDWLNDEELEKLNLKIEMELQ